MGNTIMQEHRGRWAKSLSGVGILALVGLMGCAAGARSDFDLNKGEVRGGPAEEVEADVAGLFPMVGQPATNTWTYHLQEGDKLEIVFFSHPDQNRFVTIRPDGRITLPYVGDVVAAGKEPTALAEEIQTDYAEVLVSPRVDVIVQDMGAKYYVLGEVRSPGEFAYERQVGLVQALASAGGYDDTARLSNVVLLRKDEQGRTWAAIFDFRTFMDSESRLGNIAVRPFDIIWVPRSALARWDNAARQALQGVMMAEKSAIDGWSLINFHDVYERRFQ